MNYLIRARAARRASNRIKCEIALTKSLRTHSLSVHPSHLLSMCSTQLTQTYYKCASTELLWTFFYLSTCAFLIKGLAVWRTIIFPHDFLFLVTKISVGRCIDIQNVICNYQYMHRKIFRWKLFEIENYDFAYIIKKKYVHTERTILLKYPRIQLDIDLKIIVKIIQIIKKFLDKHSNRKNFNILAVSLSVLSRNFHDLTKLFSNLYLAKFCRYFIKTFPCDEDKLLIKYFELRHF